MMASIAQPVGVNEWLHFRAPTPLDQQIVIRMNRDTLYSSCIADISQGATLTIPDSGDRYLSVMIVNQDHYINKVFHDAGTYELTMDQFDTPYVLVAVRILIDPANAADIAVVNALQDQFHLTAGSSEPFVMPDYEVASLDSTREALLELMKGLGGCDDAQGNCLPLTDGWNYIVRLYQPHPEILDGTWTFPTVETR